MDQLVGIATDPIITSSVLKEGELIEYDEERYVITRFLRSGVSHTYEAQHPRTHRMITVTVPIVYESNGDEETYFQVTDLSEDGSVATLKPWAGRFLDQEMRTIKVRWDEDAEIIRDGLMKEDHELFCTVNMLMGKEVMGDFNLLPKDPPILRMPDMVMDLIFSPLSLDDLLQCRLATPTWANDILSLPRVFNFKKICVGDDDDCGDLYFEGVLRGLCGSEIGTKETYVTIEPPYLHEVIEASLFNNVEFLSILHIGQPVHSSDKDKVRTILENCHGTRKFLYKKCFDVDREYDEILVWEAIKNFIANNHEHLQSVQFWPRASLFPGGCLDFKDLFVAHFPTLEILKINLHHKSYVRNLHLLPSSLTFLCLVQPSRPLGATEFSCITTNLMKLVRLELHLKHSHDQGDEDEVNGSTIAEIASTHPSLKAMYLAFGKWNRGVYEYPEEGVCGKLKRMKEFLEQELGTRGWNIKNRDYGDSYVECMDVVKPGGSRDNNDFEEWCYF